MFNGKVKGTASQKRQFLFLFVDGIGQGRADETNPLYELELPFINNFFEKNPFVSGASFSQKNSLIIPHDATMQLPGLPQSATGQTALLAGVNASQEVGGHVSGFPTKRLREILAEDSIFKALTARGFHATSANAYSEEYFLKVRDNKWLKFSATTLSVMAAELPFRMIPDLEQGEAIYHDLVNRRVQRYYPDIDQITPEQAGKNLASIVVDHDFTLFEYFLTDVAGHRNNHEKTKARLLELDRFLGALVEALDLSRSLILFTSDHGNIEDNSVRTHTRNSVPLILLGEHAQAQELFAEEPYIIEDLYHKVLRWFDSD